MMNYGGGKLTMKIKEELRDSSCWNVRKELCYWVMNLSSAYDSTADYW